MLALVQVYGMMCLRDYSMFMGYAAPIGPRGRHHRQIQRYPGHETEDLQCRSVVPRVIPRPSPF
jgi:hypothetical protein